MSKRLIGFLAVLAAAILWGTVGTVQSFAPNEATPIGVAIFRLVIGGCTLMTILLLRRRLPPFHTISRVLVTGAALSMALYQVSFMSAVHEGGVALGTIVALGSSPVFVGVLQLLFQNKRPSPVWVLATISAVVGCYLLLITPEGFGGTVRGVLLSLAAGGSYSMFVLFASKLLERHPADVVTAHAFFLGAIIFSPLIYFTDMTWLLDPRGLAVALYLGIGTTAVAYSLYLIGLKTIQPSTAVTLTLAEPAVATMLGIFVIGESLSRQSWIGLGFILLGLIIAIIGEMRGVRAIQADADVRR